MSQMGATITHRMNSTSPLWCSAISPWGRVDGTYSRCTRGTRTPANFNSVVAQLGAAGSGVAVHYGKPKQTVHLTPPPSISFAIRVFTLAIQVFARGPNILGNNRAVAGNSPADRHKARGTTRRKDLVSEAAAESSQAPAPREPRHKNRPAHPARLTHRPA